MVSFNSRSPTFLNDTVLLVTAVLKSMNFFYERYRIVRWLTNQLLIFQNNQRCVMQKNHIIWEESTTVDMRKYIRRFLLSLSLARSIVVDIVLELSIGDLEKWVCFVGIHCVRDEHDMYKTISHTSQRIGGRSSVT